MIKHITPPVQENLSRVARQGSLSLLGLTLPLSVALATPPDTQVGSQVTAEITSTALPQISDSPSAEPLSARVQVEQQVQEALKRLQERCPKLKTTQRVSSLSPNLLLKMQLQLQGTSGRDQASAFISQFSGLWSGLEVQVADVKTRRHKSYVTLKASIQGKPVLNQDARLLIDQQGQAQQLSSALSAVFSTRQATLSEGEAVRAALTHLNLALDAPHVTQLGYVVHAGVATAVYEVQAGGVPAQSHPVVLIDAVEGGVLSLTDRVRR